MTKTYTEQYKNKELSGWYYVKTKDGSINHWLLFTDTVGFVNKLQNDIVEAFKSTLEEIKECDLILHVVDSSNELFEDQISATNIVLDSIGVKDIPILYVFNKIDKVDGYFYIPPQYENAIRISSKSDINIDNLLLEIQNILFKPFKTTTFVVPYSKGEIINNLKENANVISIDYQEFIYVKASVNEHLYNLYKKYEMSNNI